jgi:transposase
MGVTIGVDPHKSSVAGAVVDPLGRERCQRGFANHGGGHAQLLTWIRGQGEERVVGIEGTGKYGAALARFLVAAGEEVCEVPAFLTPRERTRAPARGKSDPRDALAIARVTARGEGVHRLRPDPAREDLRLLSDHRDELVRARTQAANRAHEALALACPGYEATVPALTAARHVAAARGLVADQTGVRAILVRAHLDELERLDVRIAEVTGELGARVASSGTTLTELTGLSVVLAARIMGEVGDVARLRSEASLAMLSGTAPLPASSGRVVRHRLNRGGNRQLNRALHLMAVVRLGRDPDTQAYVARKISEGKSKREAMRCLKRHLCNLVYRHLVADAERAALAA